MRECPVGAWGLGVASERAKRKAFSALRGTRQPATCMNSRSRLNAQQDQNERDQKSRGILSLKGGKQASSSQLIASEREMDSTQSDVATCIVLVRETSLRVARTNDGSNASDLATLDALTLSGSGEGSDSPSQIRRQMRTDALTYVRTHAPTCARPLA
eukprot:6182668-Pleurochrysis_carterae.AAC.1